MKKEERWTVNRIQEADYGTDAAGRSRELLVEDQWLYENGIDEGSLWPEQGDA